MTLPAETAPETALYIASLEWQLAAAQAAMARLTLRAQRLIDLGPRLQYSPDPERYSSRERLEVRTRDLARLAQCLLEDPSDEALRHRLHSARHDALRRLADWGFIVPGQVAELLAAIEQGPDAKCGPRSAI